ncbi:MAG: hypothetical protein O7G87_14280 [bacterium]|nr:hypothetical protein [bacterium]
MQLFLIADEWPQMEPLIAYLTEQDHEVQTFKETDELPDLSTFEVGFMFIHKPIEPHVLKALIAYPETGRRLIVLHHGIASGKLKSPEWLDFVGIHIEPKDAPVNPWTLMVDLTHTLVNLNPDHYITSHNITYPETCDYTSSDAPSYPVTRPAVTFHGTEFFKNQHFADGRDKTVLFGTRAEVPDTGEVIMQDRGGWLKPKGNGWLFYFQPGHLPADFENPIYRQIIHNCLTWTP